MSGGCGRTHGLVVVAQLGGCCEDDEVREAEDHDDGILRVRQTGGEPEVFKVKGACGRAYRFLGSRGGWGGCTCVYRNVLLHANC